MSFEPRIIRPDDDPAEGDLSLPPDLELLGQQLTDDAARLAARYPAAPLPPRVEAMPMATASPRQRAIWTAAAVMLCALGLWWTAQFPSPNARPTAMGPAAPVAIRPASEAADLVPPANNAIVPAVFLQGLSGPEQEAVLDLLESEPLPQSSLSI